MNFITGFDARELLQPTQCRFPMRPLAKPDIPALIGLRRKVLSELSDPDLYIPESSEDAFVHSLCGENGHTCGVFDQGMLVAYGSVGFPDANDAENLGKPLGLPVYQQERVANIASCMVLPSHRGYGLQKELLKTRFTIARIRKRNYAIAMVSLKNHPSRHNMLAQGMRVRWIGELPQGLTRQLLAIDLSSTGTRHPVTRERLLLEAKDYTGQKKALDAGFEGWRDLNRGGETLIEFAQFQSF